jgi:uncharacterized repeat protein (TIGR01451 family)
MNKKPNIVARFTVVLLLLISQMSLISVARAQGPGVALTLAAANPETYDHTIGGGQWNTGRKNIDILETLEGKDFACEEIVSYLMKVEAPNTEYLASLGEMTLAMNYSITMDTTGQSGVALGEPVTVGVNTGDPANINNGNSVASTVGTSQTGPMFSKGSLLLKTFRLTGVEAGETIIFRFNVKILCQVGSNATGNLQVKFIDGALATTTLSATQNTNAPINGGNETVSLKSVDALAAPSIDIQKTPDTQSVVEGQSAAFTITVTNTGELDLSDVVVTDPLSSDCDRNLGVLIAGAVQTYSCSSPPVIANFTNVASVLGFYGTLEVSASDSANVTFTDLLPEIVLTKSATPSVLPESGGDSTFTFTITNQTAEPFSLNSLVDDKFGDLNGKGSCVTPQTIPGLGSYSCTYTVTLGNWTVVPFDNTATATGVDDEGNQASDSDSFRITFTDLMPQIVLTKSASPSVLPESGGDSTFTFTVTNQTAESFSLNSLVDDKFGDLNGKGSCVTPQTIAGLGSYSCTYTVSLGNWTVVPFDNTATATGSDDEGNQASDSDSFRITFTDLMPGLSLTKSATPSVLPESGGDSTFTFTVTNQTAESLSLSSLVDDKFGDLNGKGNCVTPQTIVGLGSYSCTYTVTLGDWTVVPFDNTATATGSDDEGNQVSDSDSFRITFTDLLPQVALAKSANPNAISGLGDYVDYTFTISNTGPEAVTVTSLTDPLIALSPSCLALIGQTIGIGGSLQCVSNVYLVIGTGSTFVNTATVIVADNEANTATASATATITSTWYGRTPGFWKNHPEAWFSGYTPSANIQSVFTVPSALLTGSNLDLDKNGVKDTLMAGLGYKGGSTLAGAAQILLRASVAALLNEAYYGAGYPGANSVSALIARVNSVLASQNRSSYLALAAEYDKWNNGIHSPLP